MRYQLILQFPEDMMNYDSLIEMEDRLIGELDDEADVDGHDIGSGEINLFILTDNPKATFAKAEKVVNHEFAKELKAAYREADGEEYVILWPPSLREFSVA